jgi:sugar lactone lactonase YvrE
MNRTKNLNFSVLRLLSVSILCTFTFSLLAQRTAVWTNEQANQWYKQWGWLRGCNFIPSTAINQLEMWQAETFDEATIDHELGWAKDIGMNCMRVYLHHLAWETDKKGFKKRMDKYLKIADKHHIATIFVIFDDCHNATYTAGKQPDPKPGVHNSGWLQDPGDLLARDVSLEATLEAYVKDILTTFKNDKRIVLWDLYNEPGGSNRGNNSLPLLQKVFTWGRSVNPSQPLSVGYWSENLKEINKFQLENSDVITYHTYSGAASHRKLIELLKASAPGRPMICTEYMARRNNSTFQTIMPMLKEENIGAINWGLVAGKTNTIFAWSTPLPDVSEPPVWFHDIFRKDGTPFSQEEVDFIRTLTSNISDGYASVYTQRLEDPLAVYFTPDQFDIAGDGSKDVSDALQDAINRVQETIRHGVLFIPEGTYRISKTIHVWNGIRIVGYGKKRPVFLLSKNTPNYQEGNNKYLFHFCQDRTEDGKPVRDASEMTFHSGMRNIDIRIESGNPAAIAVRFHVAQNSFLSHIDFHLNGGNVGVEDMGNEIEYCRFFGGDYGINTSRTAPGWQSLVIDSYFEKQQKAAIRTREAGLTVVRNRFKEVPTAIDIVENYSEELWVSDSKFEEISGAAVIVSNESNPRTQINLENIVCKNVPEFVFMRTSGQKTVSSHQQYLVKEFVHGLACENLGSQPAIKTSHDIVPLTKLPPPVPSDVPLLPAIETWVNLKDLGAKGDGISDDTDVLERAIASHQTIYLPTGHYRITRPVVLKEHTVLVGLHSYATQLFIANNTPAYQGAGSPVPLLETPGGGDNIVTGIGLATGGNPRVVAAKWMAGSKSMMNDVRFFEDPRTYIEESAVPAYKTILPDDETQLRKWDTQYWNLWITNGGGGTFKDVWMQYSYGCAGMCISETSTRGRIYMMSVEHHVRYEVILDKISNWKFFGLQLEEESNKSPYCLPVYIRNSSHLFFANTFSYRVSRITNPFPYAIKVENSNDLTFKGLHNWSVTRYAFENTLYDQTSGIYIRSRELALLKISGNAPLQKNSTENRHTVKKLAGGFEYIDGITVDSRGNIYFIDARKHHIYRWSIDSQLSLISYLPIYPVSLACDQNDHLMVITRFTHPPTISWGQVDAVSFDPEHPETTLQRLKNIPFDGMDGKTIFCQTSRFRTGHLHASALPGKINSGYISTDGTTVIPLTNDIGQTNSLKKSIFGKPFYVTGTTGCRTYKCQVGADGSLSDPQLFAEAGAYDVATDAEGNVYIPADNILVYSPDGTLMDEIEVPERPSTISFGGINNDILFICAGTSLYSYQPNKFQ